MKTPTAGDLRERVTFYSPKSAADDGYGNVEHGWTEEFTVSARIYPLRGGEDVMAARLSGHQPFVISVWNSSGSRRITSEWRAVDARKGTVFNIRSAVDPDGKRVWVDILAEAGVA